MEGTVPQTVYDLRCEICGREWAETHWSRDALLKSLTARRECPGGPFGHISSVPLLDITTVLRPLLQYEDDSGDPRIKDTLPKG